jgi:hypothetical protein
VAYGVVLLYLAADLYWFGGPLKKRIETIRGETPGALELAEKEQIFETANGYPLRMGELELAVSEYCLRRGLDPETIGRKRLNQIRSLVRNQLIDDRLLWQHAKASPVEVPAELMEKAKAEFRGRFASEEAMLTAAEARGFASDGLEAFLESLVQQQVWVETKIAPHIAVSEDEVRARFDELGDEAGAEFEEMRDELAATIEAEKRRWAVDGLIDHMRRKSTIKPTHLDIWVRDE